MEVDDHHWSPGMVNDRMEDCSKTDNLDLNSPLGVENDSPEFRS